MPASSSHGPGPLPLPRSSSCRSFLRRGLATAAVVLSLAACGDPAEKEARYIERGKALFAQGDRVKAQIEFKNALQVNPRSVDALYHMALISEAEGDLRVAFGSFHRVIQQSPEHVAARLKLGNYFFFAEELGQAAQHADAVLAVDARNADALALKAAIALREKRGGEARSGAEQALSIDPNNVGALSVLTGVHMAAGDVQQALGLLDGAMGDGNLPLLRLKAEIESSRNDQQALEKTYRRMIEAQPASAEHRAALTQLLVRTGRVEEAERLLRDGVAAAPSSWPMKALMIAFLVRNGAPGAAERELRALAQAEPDNSEYAFALAEFHDGRGELDKAEAELRGIAERHGGETALTALTGVARLKARAGDVNAAADLIRKVLSEDPEHAQALLLRAAMYIEDGSLMNAVTDLRTVLRRRPNERSALELLAEAHRGRGELDLAADALRQGIEVSQGDPRLRLRLASLLDQQGDRAGARAMVEAVVQQFPRSGDGWAALARARMHEKRWDAAENAVAELEKLPGASALAGRMRAELLVAQDQHAAAADAYRALLEDGSAMDRSALYAFAASSVKAGRVREATESLEKAIASGDAEAPAGWLSLGRLHLADGRRDDAAAAFGKSIALAPHKAEGYLHLGELLVMENRLDEAAALLRRGLDAGAGRSPLLFMLALTQERGGQFEQAYRTYEELLVHDPDSEVAANNIASLVATRLYADGERLRKALAMTKRLQGSRNPLIVDTVAWLAYRAGDAETAARLLDQIKGTDHPEIRYHRGAVLIAVGREDEGRQELALALEGAAAFPGREDAVRLMAR